MLAIATNAPKTGSLAVLSFALDRKAENAFLPIAVFDPPARPSATLRPILHCRICWFVRVVPSAGRDADRSLSSGSANDDLLKRCKLSSSSKSRSWAGWRRCTL